MNQIFYNWNIVLGSSSPRRQDLLSRLGIEFEIRTKDFDEQIVEEIPNHEQPEFLARRKSKQLELRAGECLITSDTSVLYQNKILNKPKDEQDAFEMLNELNGNWHEVWTGVALRTTKKMHSFSTMTKVHLREMKDEFLRSYIADYNPYDKAGAYGIQEYFGYVVVDKIEGCYLNVMGLPLSNLKFELDHFLNLRK